MMKCQKMMPVCITASAMALLFIMSKILTFHNSLRSVHHFQQQHHQRVLLSNGAPPIPIPNDIHIPSDMWQLKSHYPEWIPHSLPTCCKAPGAHNGTIKHHAKFYSSCDEEHEMERYYGPGMHYTPKDLKDTLEIVDGDIIILGDSLSRQWFEQLSCYLHAFSDWEGYALLPIQENRNSFETDVTNSFLRFLPDWRHRNGNTLGKMNGKPYSCFASFRVKLKKRQEPSRIIFHSLNGLKKGRMLDVLRYYNQEYPQVFLRPSPVLVLNIGLHYNLGQTRDYRGHFSDEEYEGDITAMVSYCHKSNAKCIFRETSPQHFNAYGGLFPPNFNDKKPICLKDPPSQFSDLSNWRNEILHATLAKVEPERHPDEKKELGFVKMMPLFDKLSGLFSKHHSSPHDCTHYKMNPEIWEPWHVSFTETLRDVYRYNDMSFPNPTF